ncbi:hypothetical protein [Sulfitobacter guttiformis]|uniref:Lipoprotein n=1 Tax=Sulfitobacter guttiformis TaxID=74349 RepID=A0A420DUC9_9RHOB|nr:hypothetical protein [Sulfitobacter guttiformis]KIN71305.1 DNA polymerase III subunit alpha [Sulfitobacter guttiformis KCTC 32187]RKE97759.1 hypothetical protein C8N30_2386 [Sulfitobacter guttiformis]
MRLLPVFGLVLSLAACSDPLAGVDRLADVDVVASDPAAAALPDADEIAREGFLGTDAAQGAVPEAVAQAQAPQTGGFFRGLINRAASADPAAAIAADVASSQSNREPVQLAPLSPRQELQSARGRTGLFGNAAPRSDKPRSGTDARDVPFGTVLAFGEMARVCDAKGKSLGQKVDGMGRRGFALFDSNPGIRSKRTFYLTGFSDDCPRQFTAANALFGLPSFYETIRYSPAGQHLPYAETDVAYDGVKSDVCRADKSKPCGTRIGKLDTQLAFVSAYEFDEINDKWKEFLIYDGSVLASAVKSY